MQITYFRSSSFNRWSWCPLLYYAEYNLGIKGLSNKKADKGTIVHKVLEILGNCKLSKQNNKQYFQDKIAGRVYAKYQDINKITEKVYKYYSQNTPHHTWVYKDYTDVLNWVWKVIKFNNGHFDPRNNIIESVEKQFNFEIQQPWAAYSYGNINGFLSLKGTVDQIVKVDDNCIEIVDWKTGKRIDWATGEEKTHEKLRTDPQLLLYYYALKHLYPNKQIITTIYFIRDGGPFTIAFSNEDLDLAESILKARFYEIRQCMKPVTNRSWKCKRLCHMGQGTFQHSKIEPLIEYRDRYVLNPQGEYMSMCDQINLELQQRGIDYVTNKYKIDGHDVDDYQKPGEV